MIRWIAPYAATLVTVCVFDFAWLGFVAAGFYRGRLGSLLLPRPNWTAAGLFYLVYAAGVLIFAVEPAQDHAWQRAFALGALFGFFCYATYDLSNLATLQGWSAAVAAVDIAWGMFITGTAAVAGRAAACWFS